jgi:hypothetical protein
MVLVGLHPAACRHHRTLPTSLRSPPNPDARLSVCFRPIADIHQAPVGCFKRRSAAPPGAVSED